MIGIQWGGAGCRWFFSLENKVKIGNGGQKKSPLSEWGVLPRQDSNPDKQNQNLRCYHYTTRQKSDLITQSFSLYCTYCKKK